MDSQELAILYSGGDASLALYVLAAAGTHPELPRPRGIHLLFMENGARGFAGFAKERFARAEATLKKRSPKTSPVPETEYIERDMRLLYKSVWIDRAEAMTAAFGGKNLVCAACRLAMHAEGVIHCVTHLVPALVSACGAYDHRDGPEQGPAFLEGLAAFSAGFGIVSRFPAREDFSDPSVPRHVLESHGIPPYASRPGRCLFADTVTTASEADAVRFLEQAAPQLSEYVEHRLEGRVREAAMVFGKGGPSTCGSPVR